MAPSDTFAAHLPDHRRDDLLGLGKTSLSASSPALPSPDERGGPDHPVHHGLAPTPLTDNYSPLCDSNIAAQPFPNPTTDPHTLPTPLQERRLDFTLNFPSSALPPTDVSLPSPHIVKAAHNLRLPSFDLLGIANPHPDRFVAARSNNPFSPLGAGPLSNPEDPLHALSPPAACPQQFGGVDNHPPTSPEAARHLIEHRIHVDTPPSEPGTLNWGSFVNIRTVGLGSPPRSDPAASPSLNTVGTSSSGPTSATNNTMSVADLGDALTMAAWMETVKVHISMCRGLPSVIRVLNLRSIQHGIHQQTTTPTAWINVFHALPGRYTLFDLPKSPPSTPGPVVEGDEFFTSKVFDSAVAVADYQLDSNLLSPSPRPVVPPGSVNVSIVERYIPPTNGNEFSEMFKTQGRSLLYDRLIELSPKSGVLLFIYPTRTGARRFMSDYLGPVLDPLLRTVTVVHEFPSDLGKSLGRMTAVDQLAEYDTLHDQLQALLQKLNELSGAAASIPEGTYSILHASREEIILDRKAWARDWWIKQEKPRVRDLVTKYFRKKVPNSDLTPSTLIQEILDGVVNREYASESRPRGIELGVFIIKKTSE
ncbi:hypothetical protein M011DRAFT_441591 [Sporormia fimetaria CBS 119925]|uniref:Uncharacterized protein n=1 Tax=Sporormia fimetaria CBS 119925 TaxID=1340428 RepID=A0A6A6VCL6_9PLEO|nr:hypothetical protein M011DRAFT_441591 [Sporormia fimetaria CBS 119925]